MSEYEKFLAARLQWNHEQGGSASTIMEIPEETDSSGTVLFRTVRLSPRPPGKRPLKSPREVKRQGPDPERASDYFSKGWAAYQLGQYERAIQDYDEAIRLNPQDADAYYNRGQLHRHIGNTKEAEWDIQKAKELGLDP